MNSKGGRENEKKLDVLQEEEPQFAQTQAKKASI